MINRENDITAKMTRQTATSNPRRLGMTTDDRTIERYRETAGERTPKELAAQAAEKEQELAHSFDRFRFPVIKASTPEWEITMLMCGDQRCFVQKFKNGVTRRSHIYPRYAAERAFRTNRISGWQDL